MAKGNEIPKVTDKNTKAELLEAFSKVVEQLEAKAQTVIDPVKEVSTKMTTAVVSRVKGIDTDIIENSMDAFVSTLKKLQTELNVFNDVEMAIQAKKDELKEMFDIDKSAYTLAALINTQNELKESFEKASAERKAVVDAQLAEVTESISAKRLEFQNEIKRLTDEENARRKKDAEEYKYKTDRERKMDEDNFTDSMNAKKRALAEEVAIARKEISDERAALDSRELVIISKEADIADMQSKIAQFPTILENATKKAEEEGKKTAATAYGFETRYLKKEQEGEVALLNNKIETLTQALEDAKAREAMYAEKLDTASERLETIATKTVDGASSAKLVSTLETALREKNTNSGK
jgi:hypothetical protein